MYGLGTNIASTGSVVGAVTLGEFSSVWYGAALRGACGVAGVPVACVAPPPQFPPFPPTHPPGDAGPVLVGRNTSILDNATVRGSSAGPSVLGNDVVVQPCAVVTSATVGDGTTIGAGAVLLPGAVVGANCYIDAGAVVGAGAVVPPGSLWTGSPAAPLRALTPAEKKYLVSLATEYATWGARHAEQAALSPEAVEQQEAEAEQRKLKGLAFDEPLPQQDMDVAKYYEMTAPADDSGVFRDAEFNLAAEAEAREAEEVEADKAETAHYYALARER